jgi:hypothetical protein
MGGSAGAEAGGGCGGGVIGAEFAAHVLGWGRKNDHRRFSIRRLFLRNAARNISMLE